MMRRGAAALIASVALAACKQDDAGPVGSQLFAGVGDVAVLDARIVPSGDSSAETSGGTLSYVIARVELTNDSRGDFTPQVEHFFFVDRNGNRFQAQDSGSSVFAGVSNSDAVLKLHEKRTYTIGFRTTDPTTSGTISYDF
jgi:hypothetical protein